MDAFQQRGQSSLMDSPLLRAASKGRNLGFGVLNSSITKVTPWSSAVPVFNPDTSYGRSFNPDFGEHHKIHLIEKRMALDNPHSFSKSGEHKPRIHHFAKSHKEMYDFADQLTADILHNPRSIAPKEFNRKLKIDPEVVPITDGQHIQSKHHQRITRLSLGNEEWLKKVERKRVAGMLDNGEFIPNMNQLQLYGRRERPSR